MDTLIKSAKLRGWKGYAGWSRAVWSVAIRCSLLAVMVFVPKAAEAQTAAERAALVAIYDATDGDNWTDNTNWKSQEPVGDWYGVDVHNGAVIGLNLENNNLTGTLPAEIGDLTSLDQLDLDSNSLRGAIPAEIGKMTRLRILLLRGNRLTGAIPAEIGNLTNLGQLYLNANSLSGAIPAEIGKLTSLELLHLYGNQLSGAIPAEIGKMTRLREILLLSNSLSGVIPAEIGKLTSLEWLDLRFNSLSGEIPKETGDLTSLENLWLSRNQLSGAIPTEIGNLNNLVTLWLDDNQLSGAMPAEIGKLTSLVALELNDNQLSGEIPATIGNLSNLEILWLHDNQLSGSIPAEIGKLTSLEWLDLRFNSLSGEIPKETGDLTSLEWLRLDNNSLTGSIPAEIANLTSLEELFLNDNTELTGELPAGLRLLPINYLDIRETCITTPADSDFRAWLAGITFRNTDRACASPDDTERAALVAIYDATDGDNWTNNTNWKSPEPVGNWYGVTVENGTVTKINLHQNNLRGTIPAETGNLTSLEELRLANNELSGAIPAEIWNMTSLEGLGLSSNQLSGTIPAEIENLTNLNILNLSFNSLSGSIPAEIGNLTGITQLRLSDNFLSGSIPAEIGNLTSLKALWLSGNQLSGAIPAEIGNLTGLDEFGLSGNQLSGAIPAEIGNLTGVTQLRLAFNSLSGAIPAEIGNMTSLEELWLHRNSLSGAIPAEIGNLTSLERLWLDDNSLSGEIPAEIGNMTSLEELDMSGNTALAGELPAGLRRLPLGRLDIRKTCITTPADSDFQEWLAGIEFFDTDRVCSGGVTASPTALAVAEGSSAKYAVALTSQPSANVTISLSFAAGSDEDITVDKTSLTFAPDTWDAAQEVTVSAAEDDDATNGAATIEHTASGGGYDDVPVSSVTATEEDNDTAGVTVTPTVLTVAEGDSAKYTVVLDTQPSDDVTISLSFAAGSDEDITVDKTSLAFTPDNWGTAQEITVSAAEDDDATNGAAAIEHTASGAGYDNATIPSVTATEEDNDTAGVTATPATLTVPEGGSATYTVALDTQPSEDVTISLSFAAGSDEDITVDKTSLTFTPDNWDAAQEVTVSAAEDDDALNGVATIEHTASDGGYDGVTTRSVTATELDNDTKDVTVTPTMLTIVEGSSGTYAVVLDTQPSDNVTITASFAAGSDEDVTASPTSLTFTPENWSTEQEVTVSAAVDNDIYDDEAALNHRASGGDYGEVAIADVAVKVTDETGQVDVSAWLARSSRVSADHLLSSIENRMERVGRDASGMQASVAGRRLAFGDASARPGRSFSAFSGASALWSASQDYLTPSPSMGGGGGYDGSGGYGSDSGRSARLRNSYGMSSGLHAAARRYRNLTLSAALSRSAFRYARQTASGNSYGIWGQGSFSRFGGSEAGADLSGDVTSGTIGVDHNAAGWLRGLAVSRSESEGDYRIDDRENFSLSSTITGVYPYARYEFTDRLQVWGAGGLGGGSLRLERDSLATLSSTSDLSMALGSAGMRGDIVTAGSRGFGLSWQTDAMLVRSSLEASRSLEAVTATVHRLRLSLKSSYILRLGSRASLAPKVQVGARRDGGEAERGMGMDVAGGLGFMHSGWGLRMQVDMHGLVAHEDSDFEEWGVSGMILFDRSPSSALGPSLRVTPSWGSPPSSGGLRALWSRETMSGLARLGHADLAGDRSLRLDSRFDYGFAAGDHGVAAPYASVTFSGNEAQSARAGANMEIGGGLGYSNASLGLIMRAGMRGLTSEEEAGFEAWGASGVVSFDPDPSSPFGASFNVSPSWGVAPRTGFGGMQYDGMQGMGAMREREPYPYSRSATGLSQNYLYGQPLRVESEMGYGFSASGGKGIATPYAGVAFSDGGRNGVLLGFNLQAGRRFLLNVEGSTPEARAISFDTLPEFRVRGLLKW